ncbi:MAG: hypothetical protein RLP44_29845 [Aggregatilineales bacterium]
MHTKPLDWHPVMLVKMCHTPFSSTPMSFVVSRMYLAETSDGVLGADWHSSPSDGNFSLAQPVGWRPERDVPFTLPVRFKRGGRGLSRFPNGTWILPYNQTTYDIYRRLQDDWKNLMQMIAEHPTHPRTIRTLLNCLTHEGD